MASLLEIIIKSIKQGTGFSDAQKDAANLDKTIGGLNKILGMAGLALGAKELIDFGKASVAAARESAAAEGELQAALISSGQASDEYTAQLQSLATALENTSLFTDEQVIKAEATLVTFKNLGQDIMPQVIATVADMGQKMGDLGSAAQLAGIVLNNPAQATARLQRQGILLTETQKEQIATMVAMGNTAGAQGILLDVLNTKYGGQAQAAREAAGGMQDWAVATGRLQEEFGKLLLAMGTESGVGGASVGLVNTLTEGSTVWADNVVQIGLFIDALNRANETLANTGAVVAPATEELSEFQKSQKGLEIIFLTVANAAIESTVGFEALADAYGEVQAEADAAAQATAGAGAVISTTPGKVNPAQRAVKAFADSIRDLTQAQQENLNAPQTNQQADAYRQMALGRTQMGAAALQVENEQNQRAADQKRAQEKEAAAESERTFKESTQAMVKATNELGNEIASAVSGAVSQSGADIAKLLGIDEEGTNRVNEDVRRMAAVASGGLANEWTQQLATQLQGVDTAQAFVNAVSSGDNAAVMEEARKLAINPIVELFNVAQMANGIEAKLRGQDLNGQLNARIQKILSEKGLDTSIEAISQVAQGTQQVADTATTSVANIGTGSAAAGEQVKAAFAGALPAVDTLIARIGLLIGLIERVGVVAQTSAGAVAGLNPPAAPGVSPLVPNGAQQKMGPLGPL